MGTINFHQTYQDGHCAQLWIEIGQYVPGQFLHVSISSSISSLSAHSDVQKLSKADNRDDCMVGRVLFDSRSTRKAASSLQIEPYGSK